ncbi:hypothetical protein CAPTEDRAFT_40946, partial [Capitella teleta]
RIPLALRDQVKEEVQKLQKKGVLEPITEPTSWVNQLVVTPKPNGKLRLCIDSRELNKALVRE